MRTSRIRALTLALTGSAALGAAAITGVAATSGAATPKGVTKMFVTAKGEKLAFSTKALRAPAGKVTLKVTNRGDFGHNIALRGKKLKAREGAVVDAGRVSKVVATLKPGTYTFYCSVFGHESGGMKGTLTVT